MVPNVDYGEPDPLTCYALHTVLKFEVKAGLFLCVRFCLCKSKLIPNLVYIWVRFGKSPLWRLKLILGWRVWRWASGLEDLDWLPAIG